MKWWTLLLRCCRRIETKLEKLLKLLLIRRIIITLLMIRTLKRIRAILWLRIKIKTKALEVQVVQVDLVVLADHLNSKCKVETCSSMNLEAESTLTSLSPSEALETPFQKPSAISWWERVKTLYNLNFTIKLIKTNNSKILLENHSESPREERHWMPYSIRWKMLLRCFKETQIFRQERLVTTSWRLR